VRLAILLFKNWHQYKWHFGTFPESFREVLLTYLTENILMDEANVVNSNALKNTLVDDNLRELAKR
jgi:hypothetical protein